MLNVAIAVDSTVDFGPQAARVVSAACEEVIGEARCPIASELAPGAVAAWYAIVHPSDPGLSSVHIEFRDRTASGVLIEERSLTFSARDSQDSRLASAGSVIAALVAAREGSLARAPRTTSAPPVEPSRPAFSLDLAALAVPAPGDEPARWGGLGRVQFGLSGRPFVLASGRYATHPGNPGFSWWTLAAGVGTRLGDRAARFHFELAGELVIQRTSLSADRGIAHEGAVENGWGGRLGGAAVWGAWRHCLFVFGVDGTLVWPRINVVVGDQRAGSVPPASLALSVGLRFEP